MSARSVFIVSIVFAACMVIGGSRERKQNSHANDLSRYQQEFVPGELLIRFTPATQIRILREGSRISTSSSSLDELFGLFETKDWQALFPGEQNKAKREQSPLADIYKLTVTDTSNLLNLIELLNNNPAVVYAEPNYIYTACGTFPDDPLYQDGSQWYIDAVNAPAAWDSVTSDTTQVIAILDTGVDWDHPDLDGAVWTNWDEVPGNGSDDDGNGYIDDIRGWDWINNDNDPNDDNSHGTHVAGIAAAENNNGTGMAGIAWGAQIMPLKVLQSSGRGSAGDIAAGINYARNNGATIINMSLGSYSESMTIKTALETAYAYCVLVAAAGNDGYPISFLKMYPACYNFVLGVQSTGAGGGKAGFSNYDPDPTGNDIYDQGLNYEVYSPGENILSTFPFGGYNNLNGTSMSAPIISGAVALLKSYDPGISTEEIFARFIQSAAGGCINIYNSLTIELTPELQFINYTIKDTMPDCNNDGTVDDGETITISFELENVGGWADSIYVEVELANPDDTIFAEILDSTAYVGDIGIYGTLNIDNDPFIIHIDTTTPYKQEINLIINIGGLNFSGFSHSISFEVTNAYEIKGILDTIMTLTPGILWVCSGGLNMQATGGFLFLPGSHLIIEEGFPNDGGSFVGHGTIDSMIIIEGGNLGRGLADFSYTHFINGGYGMGEGNFQQCIFENCHRAFKSGSYNFTDCQFINGFYECISHMGSLLRCNFVNVTGNITCWWVGNLDHQYCNFVGINKSSPFFHNANTPGMVGNNFICVDGSYIFGATTNVLELELPNQYWGTTNTDKIDEMVNDFWDNPSCAILRYEPVLNKPSDSAHGVIWKVEINGVDPQDEYLNPLESGWTRFDVYFNKCVDTSYTPLLTFGNYEPYDEHIVSDSASWSADSSIWTAWHDIGLETGDGINVIKVSGAVDTSGWDIPPEFNNRFKFVIQAASAASIEFMATGELDRVELEWPGATTNDVLGYNLYRMTKINDSTCSDSTLVNETLITDTLFTDESVTGGTTYYYFYKVVGTDLLENDRSKIASATPFSAQEGDANGDLNVDVLDITTVVSHILNQNPLPFYDYAADINNDQQVDIIDIVGIIQIISGSGKHKSMHANNSRHSDSKLRYEGRLLQLNNQDGLVALQVEMESGALNDIILKSLVQGYELSWAPDHLNITALIYSLNNKPLEEGWINLLSSQSDVRISKGLGVTKEMKLIDLLIDDEISQGSESMTYLFSPNPVRSDGILSFTLPAPGKVNIALTSASGKNLGFIEQKEFSKGNHSIKISFRDGTGHRLSNGIYYVRAIYIRENPETKPVEKIIKVLKIE